jgi:hypothetical protein
MPGEVVEDGEFDGNGGRDEVMHAKADQQREQAELERKTGHSHAVESEKTHH